MSAIDTINGVIPGGGICIVPDCGRAIDAGYLMCIEHWRRVAEPERAALAATWADWLDGETTLEDLRHAQWSCLEDVVGRSGQP